MERRMSIMAIGLLLLGTILIGVAFSQQVGPFLKYEDNPILEPQGTGFEEKAVFNPAAIVRNDTLYLLYRAEDSTGTGQWNGTSRIGLAKSTDGINFTRRMEPIISPEYDYETPGGCEDPRIVKVDDTYYLTYTAYDGNTARLALATSQDLIHWEKYGPILPSLGWSKAGAILAEKINGQYIMYFGDGNMLIAYSDDLINWTVDPNPVMRPRSGYFDANLVEPGPPPVLMEEGILLIYNGAGWSGDGNSMDRAWDVDLSPDGNYAYVPGKGTNNAKVWIIDISDPTNPDVTNTIDIPTPAGKTPEAWALQVVGNLLYVAAFQSGFWIYDITDPVNPTLVGSLVDSYTECRGLHVVGNYAYLADTWHGLSIVDIINPANPTRISLYNTDQDIGSPYIGDPNSWHGKAEFHDVRVVNDTAYCAAGNFGLVIVDVRDKSNPNGVSFCCDVITQPRWPSGLYDWARGLQVVGNYVYMGDNRTGLRIIDVSNPVAPEEAGYYSLAHLDMGEVWYPTIVENRAYIGYQRAGFIILDISNPASPESLGSYPMSGALVLASDVISNIAYVVEAPCLRTLDVTDPSNIAQIGTTERIFQYATGWVLFSKDDPTHILARAEEPILVPEKDWERFGQVDNVVFSEGLVNYNDIWYLYYGGADTRIGVARCEGPIITLDAILRLGVILEPQGNGFERDRVFNPSVIVEGDTMYMIYRAQGTPSGSFLALAKSTDGINFTRYDGNPLFSGEDPRVVKFGDTYYLFYNGSICLATSTDLTNWTQQGTILYPVNEWESAQVKAPAPVPEMIDDKYWMYYQGEEIAWHTKMGLAYSFNLFNWIQLSDPVMIPREGYFDSWGTEPGVAVMIDEGIFLIYNGRGGDGTNRNQIGWAIFDKADPSQLINRCDSSIISMPNDHVFCEGLVNFKGGWYMYWGAADQWIEGAIIDIDRIITGVEDIVRVPEYISNYPNPFNSFTKICYYLPKASHVSLKVYNLLGQEVKTLVNDYRGIGPHNLYWDATNSSGEIIASGVYFYILEARELKVTKKMLLLK